MADNAPVEAAFDALLGELASVIGPGGVSRVVEAYAAAKEREQTDDE